MFNVTSEIFWLYLTKHGCFDASRDLSPPSVEQIFDTEGWGFNMLGTAYNVEKVRWRRGEGGLHVVW